MRCRPGQVKNSLLKKGLKLSVGYARAFLSVSAALLAGTALGLALPTQPPSQQDGRPRATAAAQNRSPIVAQALQMLARDSHSQDADLRRIEELESQIQDDLIRTRQTIVYCRLMAAIARQSGTDSPGPTGWSDEPLLSSPQDLQRLSDYISDIIRRNR